MISNPEPTPVATPQTDTTKELYLTISRLESENRDLQERLKVVEQQLKQKSTQIKKLQAKQAELDQ
jgi:sensor domain CHASE-containing protein